MLVRSLLNGPALTFICNQMAAILLLISIGACTLKVKLYAPCRLTWVLLQTVSCSINNLLVKDKFCGMINICTGFKQVNLSWCKRKPSDRHRWILKEDNSIVSAINPKRCLQVLYTISPIRIQRDWQKGIAVENKIRNSTIDNEHW